MKKTLVTLGTFLLLGSMCLKAQNTENECDNPRFKDNWYIGGNIGIMPYFGSYSPNDVDNQMSKETPMAFGLYAGRQMSPVLSVRADYVLGKIESAKAVDRNNIPYPVKIDATYMNFGLTADINIINIFHYNQYRRVNPYALIGVNLGYLYGKVWEYPSGGDLDTKVRDIDAPRNIELGGTVGLGLNFNINKHFAINLESKAFLYNNKFDGGFYTNSNKSATNILWYSSLGVTYRFNNVKFLNKAEERACLEKQIKAHMVMPAAPVVDVDGAVKKAVDPIQRQLDALAKENSDLKNQINNLKNQPKQEVAKELSDYVCWTDINHAPANDAEKCPIPSVFFKVNSSTISPSENVMVDKLADFIKQNSSVKTVVLEGYADNTGATAFNKEISKKRAEAVKAALIKRGIDANKLRVEALGETSKFSNSKIDLNRRVFFRIEK